MPTPSLNGTWIATAIATLGAACVAAPALDECDAPTGVECAADADHGGDETDRGDSQSGSPTASAVITPRDAVFGSRDDESPPRFAATLTTSMPENAPAHTAEYARVKRVLVSVDVEYPRARDVGISLSRGDTQIVIRSPRYYGPSSGTRLVETFAVPGNVFGNASPFGDWSIEVGGSELAVARDCYNLAFSEAEHRASSSTESASASSGRSYVFGLYRREASASRLSSYSAESGNARSWETRACDFFFNPLHVRRVAIRVEYETPAVPTPRGVWRIANAPVVVGTYFDHVLPQAATSGPVAVFARGIDVDLTLLLPETSPVQMVLTRCADAACETGGAEPVFLYGSDSRVPVTRVGDRVRVRTRLRAYDGTELARALRLRAVCDSARAGCFASDIGDIPPFSIESATIVVNP